MAEKLEDLNLPNAVVTRIIKQAIGENTIIGKEARTALGRAASVFVLYVTSAATNMAKKGGRKTVSGKDVLDAMQELDFEEFIEPMKEYLESFKKKKKDSAAKAKQKKPTNDTEQEVEEIEIIDDDEA